MLPSIKTLLRTAVMAAAALACTYSLAARDFTPQVGTWIISSELDGKPGRGLAIDVQGNTFFMQVFGYEKNGDATFYTATGQMDGNQVTAPLMRYRGGRSFGGTARDAVEDQSVGDVTVSFKNGLKGTVQFPGEEAVAIERFLVQESGPSVNNPFDQAGKRSMDLFVQDEHGEFVSSWGASLERRATDNVLTLSLWRREGENFSFTHFQTLECQANALMQRLNCAATDAGALGPSLEPSAVRVQSLQLSIIGADLSGALVLAQPSAQQLRFIGRNWHAVFRSPGNPNPAEATEVQQNYISLIRYASIFDRNSFHNLMPTTGTWIIADELTGNPGRGLALDVQGSHVILQVFNYRPDGRAIFHMGSSAYGSSGMGSNASSAQLPLDEYVGGSALGSEPKSAQWRANAGKAMLSFTTSTSWRNQGTIQLPGEAAVPIERLRMDTPTGFADRLLGT